MGFAASSSGSDAAQLNRLIGKAQELAATLGSSLLPAITPIVTKLADAAQAATRFAGANSSLMSVLGPVVVNLAAFSLGAGALSKAFALIQSGFLSGLNAVAGFANFIVTLPGKLTAAAAAVRAFSAATAAALGPLGLAAAGVIALGVALAYLTDVTADVRGDAATRLGEFQAQAASSQQLADRLKVLAGAYRPTSANAKEAGEIIATLNKQFPGLGISVDKITGAVEGLSAGLEKLNSLMREQAANVLQATIDETTRNVAALKQEFVDLQNGLTFNDITGGLIGQDPEARMQVLKKLIADEQAKLDGLKSTIDGINNGGPIVSGLAGAAGATLGATPPSDVTSVAERERDLNKDLVDAWRERQRNRRSAFQNEIADFDAQTAVIISKFDERIAIERRKPVADAQVIAGLEAERLAYARDQQSRRTKLFAEAQNESTDATREAADAEADLREQIALRQAQERGGQDAVDRISRERERRLLKAEIDQSGLSETAKTELKKAADGLYQFSQQARETLKGMTAQYAAIQSPGESGNLALRERITAGAQREQELQRQANGHLAKIAASTGAFARNVTVGNG